MSSYDSAPMDLRPRSFLEQWVAARIPSQEKRRAATIAECQLQGDRAKAMLAKFALTRSSPGDNRLFLKGTTAGHDEYIDKLYAQKREQLLADAKAQQ